MSSKTFAVLTLAIIGTLCEASADGKPRMTTGGEDGMSLAFHAIKGDVFFKTQPPKYVSGGQEMKPTGSVEIAELVAEGLNAEAYVTSVSQLADLGLAVTADLAASKARLESAVANESAVRISLNEAIKSMIEENTQAIHDLRDEVNENSTTFAKEVSDRIDTATSAIGEAKAELLKKDEELQQTVNDEIKNKLEPLIEDTEELVVQLNKTNDRIAYLKQVIDLNSKKEIVMAGHAYQKVNAKENKEQWYFARNWAVIDSTQRVWKVEKAGKYLLSCTLQTIHKGSGSGFSAIRIRGVARSNRMMSEYSSLMAVEIHNAATFHWVVTATKATTFVLEGFRNCGDNKCGLNKDNDGFEEFIATYVDTSVANSAISSTISTQRMYGNYGQGLYYGQSTWRWDFPRKGRYILLATLRTYQDGRTNNQYNGYFKTVPYMCSPGCTLDAKDYRMVTEYQGKRPQPFRVTNHVSTLSWMKDITSAGTYARLLFYATGYQIGLQSDSNGYLEFINIQVPEDKSGNNVVAQDGARQFSTNKFTNINGFSWDLPEAGTYDLFASLRTYVTSTGAARVKLGIEDGSGPGKLEIDDANNEKYGKSVRMLVSWNKKAWSLINQGVGMQWRVKVTGKVRVTLMGKASSNGLGLQNDGNGYNNLMWWNAEYAKPGLLKLPQ